jgi:endo-1,4-beta-D-glucanase Y
MKLLLAILLPLVLPPAPASSKWPLWDSYQDHFIQKDGRVVDYERDNLTTSEGQSYAMFFALVANDRPAFERIYRWTSQNLADGDLANNLPAWSWGRKPDGTLGAKDSNSASDADLWIAYDLLQAGRLWKQREYIATGESLLRQIAAREVSQTTGFPVLLPGHTGFVHEGSVIANPSYMPLFLLEAAAKAQPAGPWKMMAEGLPRLIQKTNISGFASDWVRVDSDGAMSASPPLDSGSDQATGSYDAIRVYLWAGITAAATPGRDAILKGLSGMTSYLTTYAAPPEVASEGAAPHGTGPISFSAALIPFLQSVHEPNAAAAQQRRLANAMSSSTGLYGNPPRYYDQNLAMFSLGYTEHRYRIQSNGDVEIPW